MTLKEGRKISFTVVERDGKRLVAGKSGESILETADDVVLMIQACIENDTEALLLYPENLTEQFFDLKSGEAGCILQKLRIYRIRTVVVYPPGNKRFNDRFFQMMTEENRHSHFRIFSDRFEAERWLLEG